MFDIHATALLTNPDFYSALFGFFGTVLIFFFGLPPRINPDGSVNIILEQTDLTEVKKAKWYTAASYLGLFLLATSFLIQVVKIIFTSI